MVSSCEPTFFAAVYSIVRRSAHPLETALFQAKCVFVNKFEKIWSDAPFLFFTPHLSLLLSRYDCTTRLLAPIVLSHTSRAQPSSNRLERLTHTRTRLRHLILRSSPAQPRPSPHRLSSPTPVLRPTLHLSPARPSSPIDPRTVTHDSITTCHSPSPPPALLRPPSTRSTSWAARLLPPRL